MYWNKWYYKTIVLNIGPRMRPPGPSAAVRAPGRSARNRRRSARRRPLASARLGPAALRIEMKKEERMRELWYNVQGLKILYYFVSLRIFTKGAQIFGRFKSSAQIGR